MRFASWPSALALLCLIPSRVMGQIDAPTGFPLARLEAAWLDLRNLDDELRMTKSIGLAVSPRGRRVDLLETRVARAKRTVTELASQIRQETLDTADLVAFGAIGEELAALTSSDSTRRGKELVTPDCRAGWTVPAGTRDSLATLTDHVFACYGRAAQHLVVDGDTLDRLTIFGLLGRTGDPAKRARLFLGLQPVWQSVNGDDSPSSPYRQMVSYRVREWRGQPTPMAERALGLGVEPDTLEQWLVKVLDAWRATLPDTVFEPWDFYYYNGEASRLLSPRLPKDSLLAVNRRFYRSLGADPDALHVIYEIEPRPGKYPIAFTDIAGRSPMRAWVSASYRIGGFENLGELLHETGHAIHISAIRTRPAYSDWPDSDTFTEAIGDLAAVEMYEPDWQRKFLGISAPLPASLRAKYAGIVLDIAWALFEIRMHRTPERSPNEIWTEITRDYLKIRPHPEWSWWAMRGQLVNSPGYMLNYAFGAILIQDLRARVAALHGRFTTGDTSWYSWVAAWLYIHGRSLPSREVISRFLGRTVTPAALISDLGRTGN